MKLDPNADTPPQTAAARRSPERPVDFCGVDFGTSNSAAAVAARGHARVLGLQEGRSSIPTAVFFSFEDGSIAYGR
jgi:molecular chaperone DnaK (HSP70)